MKKFSSISNFNHAPKAFLAFLLMSVIIELASAGIVKILPPRNSQQILLRQLEKERYDAKTVILGDSFAFFTFYGRNLLTPYRQDMYKGTAALPINAHVLMAGNYFTFLRYLEHNKPPERVIFLLLPRFWELTGFQDNYFVSVFTQLNEIKDIFLTIKDFHLTRRQLLYKFFPSTQFRLYFAEFNQKSPEKQKQMAQYLIQRVLKKVTFQKAKATQEKAHLQDAFQPQLLKVETKQFQGSELDSYRQDNKKFAPLEHHKKYFIKLCDLLESKGVKVYYVDATKPKSLYEIKKEIGYYDDARAFVRSLEKNQENFTYLENALPDYFEDQYYFDVLHLNELGNKKYYASFNNVLKTIERKEKQQ